MSVLKESIKHLFEGTDQSDELSQILNNYKGIAKFDDATWRDILDRFYHGLPKYKLSDITDIEFLTKCRDYLTREVRKVKEDDYYDLSDYDRRQYDSLVRWLDTIRSYISTAKKKNKGTYDIEQSIRNDIFSCINGNGSIKDEEKLKHLRSKYRDYASLYSRIYNSIMTKERWYD